MTIENHSVQSCFKEDDIEKDRRRINLLNDPNYGIVLCFLDKFQSIFDLPDYPLQLFEDHLVNYLEENPSRLIDFHFILLKRLSLLAKNAQRDKFDSIITKFTSRFDINDSGHLTATGYLKSDIQIKIRIIKNLLESQFDLNQTLRNTLIDQSSHDIRSLPFGRDRFGVSYWLFMDNHCFVRLFREDIDINRTWTIVAKNRTELEEFIQLLITDSTVRKKFPDWTIDCEPFSSLPPSNKFEQCYSPILETEVTSTENETSDASMKRKRGRSKGSGKILINKLDVSTTKEEMQIQTRSVRKRNSVIEEDNNDKKFKTDRDSSQQDETSMDDISLAIRRSSRFRKVTVMLPAVKPISKFCKTKSKVSNNRPRQRKRTSSSTEDEYSSDDYLSDPSQIDIDDHFFELDEDVNNTIDEQLRTAKTAQTSTIITACCICFKSDRPEVLLLCDDCDDAYHLECLRPMLLSVPDGDWFCPLCEHQKLSNCLIEKFKELLINYNKIEMKQKSMTVSESEYENDDEESMLSMSSYIDENKTNISQRGRHRRTRFDIKKILNDHDEFNDNSISNDDDDPQRTNFNLQFPKKITRLLHRRDRSAIKSEAQIKPFSTRLYHPSLDSQQTLRIVRRWNDVQRRSRRRATNMKILNETMTSDYADENSNVGPDDTSSLYSNHSHSISEIKNEYGTIIQPTAVIPMDTYSSRNNVKRMDANFDRLTRDIQFAVNEAHVLPPTITTTTEIIDQQQHVKRIKNKFFSIYMPKVSLPSFLPKPSSDMYHIPSNTDPLNIIRTPSPSSSVLDGTSDQTTQIMNI